MKVIFIEGHGPMYFAADVEALKDQLDGNTHELFHQSAYVEQLHQWIKSDSVYTLLRYGSKSPSSSGVDDCQDDHYSDLYNLSTQLREADRADTENRNENFLQQLP